MYGDLHPYPLADLNITSILSMILANSSEFI
jgi:hypothetical protein